MDNEEVIDKLKTYKKLLSKHMEFDEMILCLSRKLMTKVVFCLK
jgi:hypothetical protein